MTTHFEKISQNNRYGNTICKVLKNELNYIPYNRLVKNDN